MRVNAKIFQTSTFRLAAIYLLVFVLSAGAILAYVYYNTAGLLERQTEDTIRAEVLGLSEQYQLLGISGMIETVERRSKASRGSLYLLMGPNHTRISGNLESMPQANLPDESWIDFPITVTTGSDTAPKVMQHTAHAYHVDLTGDYELLVGRDVHELRQFGDLIRRTLFWAVAMVLVTGLGGGYMMSRNFLRKVDAITDASHVIMAGDLSGRMPVAGVGDELDRLANSLNDMLSQIERLMGGMKEVTGNVAHDLRTPLTRMRARIEAALRQDSKAGFKTALDHTIEDCDKLLRTFNALLSIAQAEAGQKRQELQTLDAHETVTDVAELYEPLVEEAGGTLKLETVPGLHVRGDRQLLAQALNNLIDNAMKYGESNPMIGADIAVRCFQEGQQIVIEVADHGKGIAPENRTRVRNRFVRLDESRTKPGNGLGLSLVSSVMTLHGGQLQLEDNNPGLRAILRLPLLQATS